MKLNIKLLAAIAAGALHMLTTSAQTARPRVPVTSAMVLAALEAKHLPVEGVRIKLAAPMTSASEHPLLQVQSVTASSLHSAQLRVVCATRGDCLPFFAEATWPDRVDVVSLAAGVNRTLKEASPKAANDASTTADQASAAMSAGVAAVLLIEDDRVHVFIHVVALESGAAGDLIHVATPDHKQRYVASVVDGGLLKGHF